MNCGKVKKEIPVATVLFILANVVIYILVFIRSSQCTHMAVTDDFPVYTLHDFGGMTAADICYSGEYLRLFASMFLHVDIVHLFNNMLLLGFLGYSMEKNIGVLRISIVYIISGLAGNLASVAYYLRSDPYVVSVGASGAVFGLVGACLFLVVKHGGKYEGISISRMMLLIVYNLYSGFVNGTINNTAHIGGLAAGFVLMMLLSLITGSQNAKRRYK